MAQRGGSNVLLPVGLAAAGGVGYYLYRAGGSPRVAENAAEHDMAKLTRKAKGDMPGADSEARTAVNLHAAEVGQKVDQAVEQARSAYKEFDHKVEATVANVEKKLDTYTKEASKDLHNAVEKFDKTVEQKAAATKGWFSSWFGGSK